MKAKRYLPLLLGLTLCAVQTSCFTVTGTIEIPGPNGKAPIGHIGFQKTFTGQSWFTPDGKIPVQAAK